MAVDCNVYSLVCVSQCKLNTSVRNCVIKRKKINMDVALDYKLQNQSNYEKK